MTDKSASFELQQPGEMFNALQSARRSADHDPSSRFSRREALDFVIRARRAIETLRSMPKEDRLILAVQLITKPR